MTPAQRKKENRQRYYAANREKEIARARRYQLEHRERLKRYNQEYQKAYRAEHKEEAKEYSAAYRETHKSEANRRYQKYYADNKEALLGYQKAYNLKNPDKIIKRRKEYYLSHIGEAKERSRIWALENPEIARETRRAYQKRRLREDVGFRLRMYISCRIRTALKGGAKSARTLALLGCSIEYLRGYLEAKFLPGMSWENYGQWHIDHIRPCASFDLSDPAQQKLCFHYTNLQPLWAADNLSKGDKWAA